MRSESALPLRCSIMLSSTTDFAGDFEDLVVLTDPGLSVFFGDMLIFVAVASSCGTFSLSSMKSVKSITDALSGDSAFGCAAASSSMDSNATLLKDGLYCLLGLRLLASTSLWKGDEGGPSTSNALSSIGCVICIDGDSMLCGVRRARLMSVSGACASSIGGLCAKLSQVLFWACLGAVARLELPAKPALQRASTSPRSSRQR